MANIENQDPKKPGRKPLQVLREKNSKKTEYNNSQDKIRSKVSVSRDNSLIIQPSFFETFFGIIYTLLYSVGVSVLRKLNKYKRKFILGLNALRAKIRKIAVSLIGLLVGAVKNLIRRIRSPFSRIAESWQAEKLNRDIAKENRKLPWSSLGRVTKQGIIYIADILKTALNYVAPVVAGVFLLSVVQGQLTEEIALRVVYKGEDLGYIENERDFGQALKEVDSRLVSGLDTNYTAGAPFLQVESMPQGKDFTPKDELVNGIIRASNEDVMEAFGLYANNELFGAVVNADPIIAEIDRIQKKNMSGKPDERIEFEKAIAFRGGLYPSETIISEDKMIDIINSTETTDEIYTTIAGETPKTVALKMGILQSVLMDINPTIEDVDQEMEAGTKLFVSKARKFLSIKTIYTDVYNDPIQYTVIESQNALYAKSYRHIDSAGILGVGRITAEITTIDGVEISRIILNQERLSEPVSEQVTVGVDVHPDKDEKGFLWPGRGGYVGTVLGGYVGHSGVDINGTGGIGSPIYASASGTVTSAIYNTTGYGYHVKIDHGNGFVTLYAHASQLFVKAGDSVAKGQIIAEVGMTGRTTGPHIHFEILQGGRITNPIDYIGSRG